MPLRPDGAMCVSDSIVNHSADEMLRPQGVASVEKPSGCVGVAQRACGGSFHLMQTLDRTFLRGRGTSLLDAHAGKIIVVCSVVVFVSASYIRSSLSRVGEVLGVVSLLWSLLNVLLIRSVPEFARTERSMFVRTKKLLLVFLLSLVYTFPLLITGANFMQLQPFAGRINAPSLIDFIKTPTRVNSGGISASEEDPENPNTNFVMVGDSESDDANSTPKEGKPEPLSGGVHGGAPISAAQESKPRSASAHVIGGAAPLAGITQAVLGSNKPAAEIPRDPITGEPISLEARITSSSDEASHPDYSAGVNPAHYAHLGGKTKPSKKQGEGGKGVPKHVDPLIGGEDHRFAHPASAHMPPHTAADHTPPSGGFLEATVNHQHPAHALDGAVQGGAEQEGTITHRDVGADATIKAGGAAAAAAAADHRSAHPGHHLPEHTAADHLPPSGGFVEATVNHDHQPHELDGGVQGGAHAHDAPPAVDAPRPAAGGIAGGAQPTGEVTHLSHAAAAAIAGGADDSDAHKGRHVPHHTAADHKPPPGGFLEATVNHHHGLDAAVEGGAQPEPAIHSRDVSANAQIEGGAAADHRSAHPGQHMPEHTAADHLPPSGGFVEATVNHDHQPHELDGGVQGGAHAHDAPPAVDAPRPAAGGIAGGAQPTGEVTHLSHAAAAAIAGGADHSDAHKGHHVPAHSAADHLPPKMPLESTINHAHPGVPREFHGGAEAAPGADATHSARGAAAGGRKPRIRAHPGAPAPRGGQASLSSPRSTQTATASGTKRASQQPSAVRARRGLTKGSGSGSNWRDKLLSRLRGKSTQNIPAAAAAPAGASTPASRSQVVKASVRGGARGTEQLGGRVAGGARGAEQLGGRVRGGAPGSPQLGARVEGGAPVTQHRLGARVQGGAPGAEQLGARVRGGAQGTEMLGARVAGGARAGSRGAAADPEEQSLDAEAAADAAQEAADTAQASQDAAEAAASEREQDAADDFSVAADSAPHPAAAAAADGSGLRSVHLKALHDLQASRQQQRSAESEAQAAESAEHAAQEARAAAAGGAPASDLDEDEGEATNVN